MKIKKLKEWLYMGSIFLVVFGLLLLKLKADEYREIQIISANLDEIILNDSISVSFMIKSKLAIPAITKLDTSISNFKYDNINLFNRNYWLNQISVSLYKVVDKDSNILFLRVDSLNIQVMNSLFVEQNIKEI